MLFSGREAQHILEKALNLVQAGVGFIMFRGDFPEEETFELLASLRMGTVVKGRSYKLIFSLHT